MTAVPNAIPQNVTDRSIRIEFPDSVTGGSTAGDKTGPRVYAVTVSQEPSIWFDTALKRINDLAGLARGWNGYEAEEISAEMAISAVRFLTKIAHPSIAAPAIVPLSDGGLQVEWHRGELDVEVTLSEEDGGVFIFDRRTGSTVEGSLDEAASRIAPFIPRLSST
jgi:hypothetical protein